MEATSRAPARPPTRSGFAGSTFARGARARGTLGLGIALAALGMAWGIEHVPLQREHASANPAGDAAPTLPAPAGAEPRVADGAVRTVHIESTFPAAWAVSCGPLQLKPSSMDATQWQGSLPPGEVLITATPIDPADANLHGLRIALGDGVRAEWGNGPVTAVVPAAPAASGPAPMPAQP